MQDLDIDLVRLARILGMLGSEHAGERAAAAAKATALLKSAGLTWADFTDLLRHPLPALIRTPLRRSDEFDHIDAAEAALDSGTRLTKWEAGFLESMADYPVLSEKQEFWLKAICRKCGVRWPS